MKIEMTPGKVNPELPFPKLMRSVHTNTVIFAVSYEKGFGIKGMVLVPGETLSLKVGDIANRFTSDNFEDFFGTLTLGN